MITRYLTIRNLDPIRVDFKDGVNLMLVIYNYLDFYGDEFLGLMDTYEDALDLLAEDYLEYGDINITTDISTVLFLEDCLALEV